MEMTTRRKKKPPKKKLSAQERSQLRVKSAHIRSVRSIFRNMGFERASEIAGTEIKVGGQSGEFDDAFLYENLLILTEYTTSQPSDVTSHLKNKKIIFSNVIADKRSFLAYLREKLPKLNERLGDKFHIDRYIIEILYCSLKDFDQNIKSIVTEPRYLDFPILKYFENISGTVKKSCLGEFFDFLKIDPKEVASNGVFENSTQNANYEGSILPESSSGFDPGYKVVSFYADPAALLSRAYVLRRDGWQASYQAYQRMLIRSKIESIRKKLKEEKRVFVNNIVATLPPDAHAVLPNGKTADISKITKTEPVTISLPLKANSVGLIDGQHRLYSYYESRDDDPRIAKLRHQQNLLVTGIVYPENITSEEAERFEAELFLAINSHQTNASTALRQEIEVLLHPYSQMAIGRQVMRRLGEIGPLAGHVEKYFFDKGKLKTSSIVSYGLGPLIKLSGDDSLFKLFSHPDKEAFAAGRSTAGLEAYLNFATTHINTFLGAVRANVDGTRWTSDPKSKDRLIAVTYINSFLITLRLLIQNGASLEFDDLKSKLRGIGSFRFKDYHSSQYARMAENIYKNYFR